PPPTAAVRCAPPLHHRGNWAPPGAPDPPAATPPRADQPTPAANRPTARQSHCPDQTRRPTTPAATTCNRHTAPPTAPTPGPPPAAAPHTPRPHPGPSGLLTTRQKRCGAPQFPAHTA